MKKIKCNAVCFVCALVALAFSVNGMLPDMEEMMHKNEKMEMEKRSESLDCLHKIPGICLVGGNDAAKFIDSVEMWLSADNIDSEHKSKFQDLLFRLLRVMVRQTTDWKLFVFFLSPTIEFPNVTYLELSFPVDDNKLGIIGKTFTNITSLAICFDGLTAIPTDVVFPKVEKLWLRHVNAPQCLLGIDEQAFPQLKWLFLRGTGLSKDTNLLLIRQIPHLESLFLSSTSERSQPAEKLKKKFS
ncbi:MAG: hypothetical protein LBS23_03590 [Holosporaceae bacterium]|nr:hypothetical protein [Holosporaceae bacterium]